MLFSEYFRNLFGHIFFRVKLVVCEHVNRILITVKYCLWYHKNVLYASKLLISAAFRDILEYYRYFQFIIEQTLNRFFTVGQDTILRFSVLKACHHIYSIDIPLTYEWPLHIFGFSFQDAARPQYLREMCCYGFLQSYVYINLVRKLIKF